MLIMKNWWKVLCGMLLSYTVVAGFLGEVPALPILNESIRNLYFHVTMWFSMMILFIVSLVFSIYQLGSPAWKNDTWAVETARVAMLFGVLGLLTGMVWAKYTWGAWWVNDVKLNGAAATMLVYGAYFLLRGSMDDPEKKARISAVYSVFAFVMMIVFIIVLPRMTDSLHPGDGGNPGFNSYDLDSNLRKVFYPAIIGWTLLGLWLVELQIRIKKLKQTDKKNFIS
jgi:heme exporter protein C